MISICIPVYNHDVRELVEDLQKQADSSGKLYEILLVEDGSTHFLNENQKLQQFRNIHYIVLEKNIGRAKIRNFLAQKAKYPYLIFMDCDAKVISSQYIRKYINETPAEVVIGGYTYSPIPPSKEYLLRWRYGIKREMRTEKERSKTPEKSFSTFNFLIKKEIFNKISFDENISGYGHEDTMFGWDLKKGNITITHIDNPLLQKSPDETDVFLHKTENSVHNLWLLYQKIDDKAAFANDNQLLKLYVLLQKHHLTKFITFLFNRLRPFLEKNLHSTRPCMRGFDFYRLGVLNEYVERQ